MAVVAQERVGAGLAAGGVYPSGVGGGLDVGGGCVVVECLGDLADERADLGGGAGDGEAVAVVAVVEDEDRGGVGVVCGDVFVGCCGGGVVGGGGVLVSR